MNALTSSSWLWSCIWQSTLFLGVGGLLSLVWHHRPARSHRILVLSMVACLVTPLMSHAVRHLGWGFLGPKPEASGLDTSSLSTIAPGPITSGSPAPIATPPLKPASSSSPAMTNVILGSPSAHIQFSWQKVLVGVWVALSVLVLLRLVVSLLREVALLRRATPLQDETILRTLNRAIGHLDLRVSPAMCVSERVSSPVICCWGTHPTLVVPQIRPSADTPEAWFGILCHELAHWKRKDHWAFLVSELLACWLPWHPLVWWTGRRLNQLSELACDNWVLACGQPAQTYAESLLRLLPQRRAAWALPAVSLRTKLERRIHNIMADRPASPLPGWKWAWSSLAVTVLATGVVAVAQNAPVSEPAASKPVASPTDYTPSGLTLRLVSKGYRSDLTSCPSRDGRYVCFPNSGINEWHVRDQTSGEERLLVRDSSGYSLTSVISPDSKYMIYEWSDNDTGTPKELRLVSLDGGAPRVAYNNPASLWMFPVQWTGDSRGVLAVVKTAEGNQAVLVDVASGSGKSLRSFGTHSPRLALSPDSRYLAYDRPQEKDSPNCDLFLWDSREDQEVSLVTHSAKERLVGWSPDGKWILFTSDRAGTVDLWMVPVANGRCTDSPKFVQRAIGNIKPKGFLGDGSFYYSIEYETGDVYTALVDFDRGELTQLPSPVPYAGLKNWSEWSPDGRFLASTCFEEEGNRSKFQSLTVLEWETGQRKIIVPESLADFWLIRWAPDGRAVLGRGTASDSKRNGIYRIEVPSGKTTLLVPNPRTPFFDITPDGKNLVCWKMPPAVPNPSVVIQPMESGEARVLYSHPRPQPWCLAIAPKRQEVVLAVPEPNERTMDIKAISLEGGQPRQVYRHQGKGRIVWLECHPEGKSILFLLSEDDGQVTLWQVPAQGGVARQIAKPFRGMNYLRVHPDGRRIAFSSTMLLQHEVWVMEHFLPK